MDGSRFDRPVNSGPGLEKKLPLRATNNKRLLKVSSSSSAPVELTPLSRLAKFKEIRDRNLAKASQQSSRTSLASRMSNMIGMDQQNDGPSTTNGVAHTNGKPQVKSGPSKQKPPLKTPKEQNGVESAQNGTEPSPSEQVSASAQNGISSAGKEGPQSGVEAKAPAPQPEGTKPETTEGNEVVQIEIEEASGSEADNGQESEGSSLDVVIDESSSGESLDLNVTAASSSGDFQVPAAEVGPVDVKSPVDEPFVPDVVKRLESGGRISSRPTLRGKRSAEGGYSEGVKRARTDDTEGSGSLSTSWQFFSPRSVLRKVWTRQSDVVSNPKPDDDSMLVNVSDVNVEEPKTGKWCRIM